MTDLVILAYSLLALLGLATYAEHVWHLHRHWPRRGQHRRGNR